MIDQFTIHPATHHKVCYHLYTYLTGYGYVLSSNKGNVLYTSEALYLSKEEAVAHAIEHCARMERLADD